MQIERLDTTIDVAKRINSTGVYGEPGYQVFATVQCRWTDLNSVELLKADATQGYCYATLKMRDLAGLSAACRVYRGEEEWDIIGAPKRVDTFVEFKVQRAVAG